MCMITEIVTMKTATKLTKEEFIRIVDGLERNFHSKQPGFMDTELLYNEKSDEWIMVQHWASREEQKAASKKMFEDEGAATFVQVLDPKTVKMNILPQLGKWAL